mgnify:CR=1 FL=1
MPQNTTEASSRAKHYLSGVTERSKCRQNSSYRRIFKTSVLGESLLSVIQRVFQQYSGHWGYSSANNWSNDAGKT